MIQVTVMLSGYMDNNVRKFSCIDFPYYDAETGFMVFEIAEDHRVDIRVSDILMIETEGTNEE